MQKIDTLIDMFFINTLIRMKQDKVKVLAKASLASVSDQDQWNNYHNTIAWLEKECIKRGLQSHYPLTA